MELGLFILLVVLLLLLPLILFIVVAVWMYRDANARGMNGGIWVVLLIIASLFGSFIGGLIVVLIYLLLRGGHLAGAPYQYGYGYPPPGYGYPGYPPQGYPPQGYPQAPPQAAAARCPRCGAPIHPDARFCPSCGSQLKP